MKKSEMYKKTIVDVICASGGEITDGRFEQLLMLFETYTDAVRCEKVGRGKSRRKRGGKWT